MFCTLHKDPEILFFLKEYEIFPKKSKEKRGGNYKPKDDEANIPQQLF